MAQLKEPSSSIQVPSSCGFFVSLSPVWSVVVPAAAGSGRRCRRTGSTSSCSTGGDSDDFIISYVSVSCSLFSFFMFSFFYELR